MMIICLCARSQQQWLYYDYEEGVFESEKIDGDDRRIIDVIVMLLLLLLYYVVR